MSTTEDLFIALNDETFDWDSIVVDDPVTNSSKKGNFDWVTSKVYVPGPNGEKQRLFIELAKQTFWGVNPIYPFELSEDEKNSSTIDGYQIAYPLTSLETKDEPTNDELATKEIFDKIRNITWKAMERFCKDEEDCKVPESTYNSYLGAKKKKNKALAVKPLYEYPLTFDTKTKKKIKDHTKPQRSYIKLVTRGKGDKMKCNTSIYGPDDKIIPASECISTFGKGQPLILWNDIFWGSHGKNGYGASARVKLTEMNFLPREIESKANRYRMLPSNKTTNETKKSEKAKKEDDENLAALLGHINPDSEEEEEIEIDEPTPTLSEKKKANEKKEKKTISRKLKKVDS